MGVRDRGNGGTGVVVTCMMYEINEQIKDGGGHLPLKVILHTIYTNKRPSA